MAIVDGPGLEHFFPALLKVFGMTVFASLLWSGTKLVFGVKEKPAREPADDPGD